LVVYTIVSVINGHTNITKMKAYVGICHLR